MTSAGNLTLAFLERQPRSAARVLEDLDPADGAAFLETVPGRLAGPVVGLMASWSAARSVELLAPERAAGLIRNVAYQDAAILMRLVARARLAPILDQLPKGLARDFRAALSYPKGAVGAWMDHSVPVFSQDRKVSDGLKFAGQRQSRKDVHIFVVGEKRQFLGAVSVSDLLCTNPETPLSDIMDRNVQALSNRASLASIAAAPDWDEYLMLPVVGRRRNVLGGLSRSGLRKGLSEERATDIRHARDSILAHLFETYLVASSGLLQLASHSAGAKLTHSSPENDRVRKPRKSG